MDNSNENQTTIFEAIERLNDVIPDQNQNINNNENENQTPNAGNSASRAEGQNAGENDEVNNEDFRAQVSLLQNRFRESGFMEKRW